MHPGLGFDPAVAAHPPVVTSTRILLAGVVKLSPPSRQNPNREGRTRVILGSSVCGATHSRWWALRGGFDGGEWGTNELALSMAGLCSVSLMTRTHQKSRWCCMLTPPPFPHQGLHFNHLCSHLPQSEDVKEVADECTYKSAGIITSLLSKISRLVANTVGGACEE